VARGNASLLSPGNARERRVAELDTASAIATTPRSPVIPAACASIRASCMSSAGGVTGSACALRSAEAACPRTQPRDPLPTVAGSGMNAPRLSAGLRPRAARASLAGRSASNPFDPIPLAASGATDSVHSTTRAGHGADERTASKLAVRSGTFVSASASRTPRLAPPAEAASATPRCVHQPQPRSPSHPSRAPSALPRSRHAT
jgi:hypothetical protein